MEVSKLPPELMACSKVRKVILFPDLGKEGAY